MNFTPELLMFQGVLLSADSVHNFVKISGTGGNEEIIDNIISRVFNFLQENNYLTENGVTEHGKSQMRIYCLYLVLNTDVHALESIADLPDIESIMFTAPLINKHLISAFIWRLHMHDFVKEILVFCHPCLVVQLAKHLTYSLKFMQPTKCLKQLNVLMSGIYKFICRLHFYTHYLPTIPDDAYNQFILCLNYYVEPPNKDKLNHLTEEERDVYKGHYLYSLLTLTMECLNCYSSIPEFESDGFNEMYLYTVETERIQTRSLSFKMCNSTNTELRELIEKFNVMLLDKLQALIMDVSVQVFCAWTEYEENGKSMQQTIRETCYKFHEQLSKVPTLLEHRLLSMLPQMSCKPTDIHDIISGSDIDTIIQNATEDSEDKIHWVRAIINSPHLSNNKELLETLLSNINLIEPHDHEKIITIMLNAIKNVNHEHREMHKLLAIKAFTLLEDEVKVKLTLEQFPDRLFNNDLQCEEFQNMNIKLFNKLISSPDTNIHDVYNTFIQNPLEIYIKIVSVAVDNSKQIDLMLKIMIMLKQFLNHFYNTDTDPALFKVILNACKNKSLTDVQLNNLVQFIIQLKTENIVCEAKFLLLIIMPGLHEALVDKDIRLIKLNLQFLKHGYEVNELLKYRAPLLAMIGQIMEVVRWTNQTFISEAPTTLEEALHLQMNVFKTYNSQIPVKEANWLKNKLQTLQPLNIYYFKELWNPQGNDYLEIITGQENLSFDQSAVILAKILPSLTSREWQNAWCCILSQSKDSPTALQALHSALQLLCSSAEGNAKPCLLYCYTNYTVIIKNYFSTEALLDVNIQAVVDIIIFITNSHSAMDIEEISRIFLPLISYIIDRKQDYKIDLSYMANKIKHPSFAETIHKLFNKNK